MASCIQWLEPSGSDCGYCSKVDGSYHDNMWTFGLAPEHYQALIDRGWRRAGKLCYKPEMKKTCCPQYTIKCNALSFRPTRSHKKILKRMNKFLMTGDRDGSRGGEVSPRYEEKRANETQITCDDANVDETMVSELDIPVSLKPSKKRSPPKPLPKNKVISEAKALYKAKQKPLDMAKLPEGPLLKRRHIRLCKWMQKRKAANLSLERQSRTPEKTLEEWFNFTETKHKLDIRLVRTAPYGDEAQKSENCSHNVFLSYQMGIHKESKERWGKDSWKKFLVNSPLHVASEEPLLGSFHQQYWLDDQLIAVGVLDILPKCVSAVYFYYDPAYSFLSLGTFGSLNEIRLIRELQKKSPQLQYYYMGFYIHDCPKMRYKGKLPNSQLLCPETYLWAPIEKCIPMLDAKKYSGFHKPTTGKADGDYPEQIDSAAVIYKNDAYHLIELLRKKKVSKKDYEQVQRYCVLVGEKLMQEIYFCLKE